MDTGLFSSKSFLGLLCEVAQIVSLEFGVTQNLIEQDVWRDLKTSQFMYQNYFPDQEHRLSIISRHVMSCAVVSARSEKEYIMLFMQWKKS